jgi:prevent-host-death family protein
MGSVCGIIMYRMFMMGMICGGRRDMETVSVVEARRMLSELLGRVAYARERVVVERKGKPMAALVSIEDLRRLEALEPDAASVRARREAALAMADVVRQRMLEGRHGVPLPDSAETLNALREERIRELTSLHR